MKSKVLVRRAFALSSALALAAAGCELAVDFDRTKIDAGSVDGSIADVVSIDSPVTIDGGADARLDAPIDALTDTSEDALTDSPIDVATDTRADSQVDAGADAPDDAPNDADDAG